MKTSKLSTLVMNNRPSKMTGAVEDDDDNIDWNINSTSRIISTKIINAIENRSRLQYKCFDVVRYLSRLLCIRSMYKWGKFYKLRKHLLYKRGYDKIQEELDVLNLIKSSA